MIMKAFLCCIKAVRLNTTQNKYYDSTNIFTVSIYF